MKQKSEKCPSMCGDKVCELPQGHKWKHKKGGAMWTDAGAARVNQELEAKREFDKEVEAANIQSQA